MWTKFGNQMSLFAEEETVTQGWLVTSSQPSDSRRGPQLRFVGCFWCQMSVHFWSYHEGHLWNEGRSHCLWMLVLPLFYFWSKQVGGRGRSFHSIQVSFHLCPGLVTCPPPQHPALVARGRRDPGTVRWCRQKHLRQHFPGNPLARDSSCLQPGYPASFANASVPKCFPAEGVILASQTRKMAGIWKAKRERSIG